jgi:hypothetical protein
MSGGGGDNNKILKISVRLVSMSLSELKTLNVNVFVTLALNGKTVESSRRVAASHQLSWTNEGQDPEFVGPVEDFSLTLDMT